jgi:hypothetical protein
MKAKITEVETTIRVDKEMQRKLKNEKSKMTKDFIKERILKMLKEYYDDESVKSNINLTNGKGDTKTPFDNDMISRKDEDKRVKIESIF